MSEFLEQVAEFMATEGIYSGPSRRRLLSMIAEERERRVAARTTAPDYLVLPRFGEPNGLYWEIVRPGGQIREHMVDVWGLAMTSEMLGHVRQAKLAPLCFDDEEVALDVAYTLRAARAARATPAAPVTRHRPLDIPPEQEPAP